MSAILLHQGQAGEIAKTQLPCMCIPFASMQIRILPIHKFVETFVFLPHTSNTPETGLAIPVSYEELRSGRLANIGNPRQARQPVWRPCHPAHPR